MKLTLDSIYNNVLIGQFLKSKIYDQIEIPEAKIEEYYENNKEEFKIPSQYQIKHILTRLPLGADEDTQKKAKDKISAALERLKSGEAFEQVVQDLSEDTSSIEKGGDLGFLFEDQIPLEIKLAIQALKVGEHSKVIRSRYGYQIVKLQEQKEAKLATYEEAKEAIKYKLFQQASEELLKQEQIQLREKSGVKINDKLLHRISG